MEENNQSSVASIQKLVNRFGGQKYLAEKLGVQQAHISIWITRDKKPPLTHVKKMVEISEGLVTKYDLRPDIFGKTPTINSLLKQIINLFWGKYNKFIKISSKIITTLVAIIGLGAGMYFASIFLTDNKQQIVNINNSNNTQTNSCIFY